MKGIFYYFFFVPGLSGLCFTLSTPRFELHHGGPCLVLNSPRLRNCTVRKPLLVQDLCASIFGVLPFLSLKWGGGRGGAGVLNLASLDVMDPWLLIF